MSRDPSPKADELRKMREAQAAKAPKAKPPMSLFPPSNEDKKRDTKKKG